jgi:hypothetical protein
VVQRTTKMMPRTKTDKISMGDDDEDCCEIRNNS